MKVAQLCPNLCSPVDYSPLNSLGQNTGVGSLSLLQGIVPIQGSNPCVPHCRQLLYQLSHRGNPRISEWVAYPFSSSQPRNWIGISCIAGRFFTYWAIRESWVRRPIKVSLVMLKRWLLESTKGWGLVASSQACDQRVWILIPTPPNLPNPVSREELEIEFSHQWPMI